MNNFGKIFMLSFVVLLSCNNNSAQEKVDDWIGWYGETAGGEAWLNIYQSNDSLYCKLEKSEESKTFSTKLITDISSLDLRVLPKHLVPGIPYIKEAILTENFYLFKVKKSGIPDFISEYYFFVPLAKVGGPMKKMNAPNN